MSVSNIASLGVSGIDWLRSHGSSSTDAPSLPPVAPAAPPPQTQQNGTANLPQQFSREVQSFLLQLQSSGLPQAQGATSISTGKTARTVGDGDRDVPSRASEAEGPHPGNPTGTLETGSPDTPQSLAANGAPAAPAADAASSPVNVWSGSSSYPAALQAYVKNTPPPPMNLQQYV